MARTTLPPKVVAALQAGNKPEAIRQLQLASGMSLKQARDVIEVYSSGGSSSSPTPSPPPASSMDHPKARPSPGHATLPPEAVDAMRRGNLIEAIKIIRQTTGAGLSEAKAMVDELHRRMPRQGIAQAASARRPGLAPGEMPRDGGMGMWIMAAAMAIGILVLVASYT